MCLKERETKHISELPAMDIRFLLAFELISWWLSVVFYGKCCSNFFFFLSSFCRKPFGESLPKFIPHLSRWFCTFWCIFCVSAREADKSYWIIHDKSFENNSSPTFFSSSDFHSSHFSASNLNLRLVFRKRGTLKSTQIQHNDWTMTLLRRCAEHMLATSTWSSTIIPLNFPPSTCSRGSIVHVSLVCSSSFFFLFGHFPLLGGVIYVLTCVCAFYKAPCELEIWQLFASPGLWLTDVIFAVQAVRVVELNLQPGTGRIQVRVLAETSSSYSTNVWKQ